MLEIAGKHYSRLEAHCELLHDVLQGQLLGGVLHGFPEQLQAHKMLDGWCVTVVGKVLPGICRCRL